jgi:formate dehydrogenase maturation protein FdhE
MRAPPSDNEESNIADDPVLSAISTDLERVDSQTDNRLLFVLGAIVLAGFLTEHFFGKSPWLEVLGAVAIVSAIAATITSAVRRKADLAVKYRLICPVCKHRPSTSMVLAAAMTLRCQKCGAELNG